VQDRSCFRGSSDELAVWWKTAGLSWAPPSGAPSASALASPSASRCGPCGGCGGGCRAASRR